MSAFSSRVLLFSLCSIVFGACTEDPDQSMSADLTEPARAQLTANPCTTVTLASPGPGWTVTVGQSLALSAIAQCPTGQTPEFEYWIGTPTAGGTVFTTLLGGKICQGCATDYVPSGDTFTPVTAGQLCLVAAARALGSSDDYQARSSAVCGTVSNSSLAPTFVQVAGGSFQFAGNVDPTTQLFVAQTAPMPDGTTVTAGSLAVQCIGSGGGFIRACQRTREIGAFQCGPVVACGTAASSVIPFATPFVAGPQSHLDVAIVGTAPTLIPTIAVLTIQ